MSDVLAEAAATPVRATPGEALEAITSALRDSVRAHLVSDVPVGLFLSSGLDSTLIASTVAHMGVRPLTLTLGVAEYHRTPRDEVPLAEAVARQLGANHRTVLVKSSDFSMERERLLAAMDQPSIDGVNTWFIAKAASEQGLKVALSGIGGDELFGSYPSFRQVPLLAAALGFTARWPQLGERSRKLLAPIARRMTSPKYAGLLEYGSTFAGAYLLRRGLHMPWELPDVMDRDMAREGLAQLDTLARLDDSSRALRNRGNTRLAVSALETNWYLHNQLLRDADWAGMAHSVEIRTPLADIELLRRVVPYLAGTPAVSRRALVQVAAPGLPREVRDRVKTGFHVPVRQWLGAPASASRGLRGWSRYVLRRSATGVAGTAPGMLRSAPRVLVSTIAPGAGGVNAMTQFAVRVLASHGLQAVLAHYAPYTQQPSLSVPSFRLLQRAPGASHGNRWDGHEVHGFGAWLPELEFTHYAPTHQWRELMDTCEAFVAVSGNILAATPFLPTGRPYLAWVATDWAGDRRDRVRAFPLLRRLLDAVVNARVIGSLEIRLLKQGCILPVSEYTRRTLTALAGSGRINPALPVPVDTNLFVPRKSARIPGRIGFAGRFNDPRKNLPLLLRTMALLCAGRADAHLVLMGDSPDAHITGQVEKLGLAANVRFAGGLSREQLASTLQTLDVFVLPSHQEGLCIAALEAMSCGVPVVSTRCGGPEEFVLEGITGRLSESDAGSVAEAVTSIMGNEALRSRMSANARVLVVDRYSERAAEQGLVRALARTFPNLPLQPLPASAPRRSRAVEPLVAIPEGVAS